MWSWETPAFPMPWCSVPGWPGRTGQTCGTGSGASVLALTLMGRVTGQDVAVSVPGGTLRVTIDREDEDVRNIWLTGPTNIVCKGEITDEELEMRNEE